MSMLCKPHPPGTPNFDPVARLYRWAEYLLLGPLLARTRGHFLPQMAHARCALVLGDGDGRFVAQLLRQNPGLDALAVDGSAAMLALVRKRCRFAAGRLTTRQALIPPLPADLVLGEIDLIVSHFFLDCLSQAHLESLAAQLAHRVRPGCLWVVSDFGLPRKQPWRTVAQLYVRGLYLAFRLLTRLPTQSLPEIEGALTRAGFIRVCRADRLQQFLYSELWRLDTRPAVS